MTPLEIMKQEMEREAVTLGGVLGRLVGMGYGIHMVSRLGQDVEMVTLTKKLNGKAYYVNIDLPEPRKEPPAPT